MIRRLIKSVFLSFSFLLLFSATSLAGQDFIVNNQVLYEVQESGLTKVTNQISIENLKSEVHATSYKLHLVGIDPQNIHAQEGDVSLIVTELKDGENHTLTINFENSIVGKNEVRNFELSFTENSFAVRTGEVWEITIPRLINKDAFDNYNLTLSVPDSLGLEAYISPTENSRDLKDGKNYYYFDKDKIARSSITAGFGKFQVFNFDLNYHLENPLNRSSFVEIALPPDTSLQKVRYKSIDPEPENVRLDQDGNWLAGYILAPHQRLDISVQGNVQIFASPRKLFSLDSKSFNDNLKATQYWQVEDPKIKDLAKSLKTPEKIYRFVVDTLIYDYRRVKPNVERSGAIGALENPNNAICMEFTDLFVTLARAAGIPAREVNGFAYTENPEIQPLSMVADVLHAWPEYWDGKTNTWVSIDPTWEKTTGGVDFFNKLDLRHFTFVIHGASSTLPYPPGSYKLGTDPQKDVYVTFGQLQSESKSSIEILAQKSSPFPLVGQKITFSIKNSGQVAIYGLSPRVLFDKKVVDSKFVEVFPPYSIIESEVLIPFSFLGRNTPVEIEIAADGESITLYGNKNLIITYNLISIFLIIFLVIIIIMYKTGKITKPGRLLNILKNRHEKTSEKQDINEKV